MAPATATPPARDEMFEIRDARVIFKNFSGREEQFNKEGDRNFSLVLTKEDADMLAARGFNVKSRPPREEGDDPLYYLKINVKFDTKGRPPRVVMVNTKNKVGLDSGTATLLDMGRITHADVRFRAWNYDPGKYSAYLVTGFFNMEEDELEDRYSDLPEQGISSSGSARPSNVSFNEFDD